MTQEDVLNLTLLNLADGYEGHRTSIFSTSSPEEYEPLREFVASMDAEGFARSYPTPQCWMVRLTPQGYRRFKARIDALRAMP